MKTWESSGTPEVLELDCKGQNTLPWGFLYIVGKVLKCRCRKWPCMSHSNICSTSYVRKKAVWLPTTKSRKSTRFTCVQAACDIPLKSSRQGLQLCFRPHHDRRSAQDVMRPQSCESPNYYNFGTPGTPIWESWVKRPFGCGPRGEAQSILYGGRWWLPPGLGRGESSESKVARGLS
jgi:hypothetical protein